MVTSVALVSDDTQNPELVAQQWLSATIGGDGTTLGSMTCRDRHEDASTTGLSMAMLNGLGMIFGTGGLAVDLSGVSFRETQREGNYAIDEASGYIYVSVAGAFQENYTSGVFTMVYEDNRWKVCEFVS